MRRTRPDLRFETVAYAACVAPPEKAAMDPGVLVDFCPIGQCFECQIDDPKSERNAEYAAQLEAWRRAFKGDISIYSYYRKYAWQSLPVLLPHYMQNDLRFYQRLGVRGVSSYAEPGDWGTYELNHYVLGGLAWNPAADLEAMLSEFAQARFGSAAALGSKTYQLLEDNVRHVCSLPGTALKTAAEYQHASESFQPLAQELEKARVAATNSATTAALRRLELVLEYAQRDLALQQGRAVAGDGEQSLAKIEALGQLLQEHASDGVFVAERISPAKQAVRYGLPSKSQP
jgi:hypothetical protein